MRPLILSVFVIAAVTAAQDKQTFTGTITDSECADADHSHMQMGPTDAETAPLPASVPTAPRTCSVTARKSTS